MSAADRYPNYRAPQGNREILCDPPWHSLPELTTQQRRQEFGREIVLSGVPLPELATRARQALRADAMRYTQSYAETATNNIVNGPLVITGHQPELFHPGVWLKNFAAGRLANEVGGVAIDLVIDSDLCRTPAVRVPTGSVEHPRVVDVAFDQPLPDMPYEQRFVVEPQLWRSFGERATNLLSALVSNPLVTTWWPELIDKDTEQINIGQAIAQARHQLELAWGNNTLELPQSIVCQSEPFRQFAWHVLRGARTFREAYNHALADYRAVHRLRSAAQPLPDLEATDDWIETPFWIWTKANPTRRALFVRPDADTLQVSDRQQWSDGLPLSQENDPREALAQLARWENDGVKLRTRALLTTLYARLVLADVFIHGIGGAKYDQVTDEICARFFSITPPQYVALSGTLRLPIDHRSIPAGRTGQLRRKLRELRYHPEKYVDRKSFNADEQAKIERWIAQKKHWVQTPKTDENAAERHAQIVAANEALQHWLQTERETTQRELTATVSQTRINRLLESREYPFCLYPRELLRDFLLDFPSSMP